MSARTTVDTVLNTLTHERHAREALLAAFGDDLRAVLPEAAPESTRTLEAIARAERGELDEDQFTGLLADLRALVAQAA